MARPGVIVQSRADAPPRSASTDTSMAFMVGATASGANIKTVSSFGAYQTEFGVRTGFVEASDAAEAFFREGGAQLTVSRAVVGATTESSKKATASDVGGVEPLVVDPTIAAGLARIKKSWGPG